MAERDGNLLNIHSNDMDAFWVERRSMLNALILRALPTGLMALREKERFEIMSKIRLLCRRMVVHAQENNHPVRIEK